jgi:hypothetical protein
MMRAQKMCPDCPFRGLDADERRELAMVPPEWWPCHTEQGFAGSCDIQCRGHWEARRKFTVSP